MCVCVQVDEFVGAVEGVCYMANMTRDYGAGFVIRSALAHVASLAPALVIPRIIDEGYCALMHALMHIYIYIYIYIERERERERLKWCLQVKVWILTLCLLWV